MHDETIDDRHDRDRDRQRDERHRPCDDGPPVHQFLVDDRQDQTDREAGDHLDRDDDQEIEILPPGHGRCRSQQERAAPAQQLQVPERAVLVVEERSGLDGQDRHDARHNRRFVVSMASRYYMPVREGRGERR